MTLGDDIIALCDTPFDIGGILTSTARSIKAAQRFVLQEDVALACGELAYSKPSSLIAALPLCRLPYPKIWIENRGGLGKYKTTAPGRPVPLRQGALIEAASSNDNQKGFMTLAWVHRTDDDVATLGLAPTICPFAIYFDWHKEGNVNELVAAFIESLGQHSGWTKNMQEAIRRKTTVDHNFAWTDQKIFEAMAKSKDPKMQKFSADPKEIEAMRNAMQHAAIGISPHAVRFLATVMSVGSPDDVAPLMLNWMADTHGEASYVECFLAMLNSRNPVVEHERQNLSKLNRARAKAGKRPFLESNLTRLHLSRSQAHRANAAGISREAARQHLVRGHFKIRSTGVFWWSSFLRGDVKRPVERQHYEVSDAPTH